MLLPLILKDLKLFAADRRDVIVTIVVPIALAAFMAFIFGSRTGQRRRRLQHRPPRRHRRSR